jgi:hypothetical protein
MSENASKEFIHWCWHAPLHPDNALAALEWPSYLDRVWRDNDKLKLRILRLQFSCLLSICAD